MIKRIEEEGMRRRFLKSNIIYGVTLLDFGSHRIAGINHRLGRMEKGVGWGRIKKRERKWRGSR